ncbi:MAG: TonB-dependent receptor [Acidobacteriota bacterium]
MRTRNTIDRTTPSVLKRIGTAWLCAVLAHAPLAQAAFEDDDFVEYELLLFEEEEVVAAASRRVQKLSEAPGSITVLQADELEDLGVLTLGDLLHALVSLDLVPQTQAPGFEIRGVRQPFGNKVLLLQDGRRLNSIFRGEALYDLTQPIDHLQRVEIVRGPGSALYGANALGGFINLVTETGEAIEGHELRASLGVDDTRLFEGTWGRSTTRGELVLRGRAGEAAPPDGLGPDDREQRNVELSGRWVRNDWTYDFGAYLKSFDEPGTIDVPTPANRTERRGLHADVRWARNWGIDKRQAFRVTGVFEENVYRESFSDLGLEVLTPGWVFQNTTFVIDEEGEIQQSPSRQLLDGRARAGIGDLRLDIDAYRALQAGTVDQDTRDLDSRERSLFGEYHFDWTISDRHSFLAGASARFERVSHEEVGRHLFANTAVVVEDQWRFFDSRFIVSGSARYDRHRRFGSSFSPRLSLIGKPHDRLVLKASYGTAFRSPNFVELFAETRSQLLTLRGNPDLEQEDIATIELEAGLELSKKSRLTLTLYDYRIDGEVVLRVDRRDIFLAAQWDELGSHPPLPVLVTLADFNRTPVAATFINGRGTEGHGFELAFRGQLHEKLSLRSSIGLLDTDRPTGEEFIATGNRIDRRTGEVLPGPVKDDDVPELAPVLTSESFRQHRATLQLRYRPTERVFMSARASVTSARDASFLELRDSLGRYNLTAGVRLKRGFTLSGTLRDVFGSGPELDAPGAGDPSFHVTLRRTSGGGGGS